MPYPDAINFDPEDAGILDWFSHADADGKVRVEFMTQTPYPANPTHERVQKWLRNEFKALENMGQIFFTSLLALTKKDLLCTFISSVCPHGKFHYVEVEMSLPQLLMLPNQNPAQELGQLNEFFDWANKKARATGVRAHKRPSIQWFRAGYRQGKGQYGLEWCGVAEADRDAWNKDLQDWRKNLWFDDWYKENIKHMKKLRFGPHCWLSLSHFESKRALFGEFIAEEEARKALNSGVKSAPSIKKKKIK